MRIEGLHHVQLAMPPGQEQMARDFYEGMLDIPEVAEPPRLAKRVGCWFERGALRVHLGVEREFRPAGKAHPALSGIDLAAQVHRLERAGYPVVEDEPLPGYQRRYVDDLFGNRIELIEPA